MGKFGNSEDPIERCFREREGQVSYTRAKRYAQLDNDGTDFLLDFKIKGRNPDEKIFFPLSMRLQVKMSNNGETVGLVLPLYDGLPRDLKDRITEKMWRDIKDHQETHPHVSCILFVAQLEKSKSEKQIIVEIWREIRCMLGFIRRHYFPRLG